MDPNISTDRQKDTATPIDRGSSEAPSSKLDLEKQTPGSIEPVSDAQALKDEPHYPPMQETILIMISLFLTMFLMALVSAARGKVLERLA